MMISSTSRVAWRVAAGPAGGGRRDHLDAEVGDVLRDGGEASGTQARMGCVGQALVTCSPDCTLSEVETCRSSELQSHCLPVKFSFRHPYSMIPARISHLHARH
jgi:hypothetical protein